MSERKLICFCYLFLIDVWLTHTNTHTRTHTEIKATQAGVQQIKKKQPHKHKLLWLQPSGQDGLQVWSPPPSSGGKKKPDGFMSFCCINTVQQHTHTHTHTHWLCLKLQLSDCHIDSEASPSPLLAIHALVSFLRLISAVLSQPQQWSTYQPRWLKINFIAISKPSAWAVYGLIHLCLPNYWSVSEKKWIAA